MPMIDAHIPEGALRPEAEAAMIDRITGILIGHEGFDPTSPTVRAVSWVFVHRPTVFVAGAPAEAPYYKIVVTVPEGQLDQAARNALVADVTEAVLDAEEGTRPRDPGRVWVFPTDMLDGHWGGRGRVMHLPEILQALGGHDRDEARELAAKRINAARADHNGQFTVG